MAYHLFIKNMFENYHYDAHQPIYASSSTYKNQWL